MAKRLYLVKKYEQNYQVSAFFGIFSNIMKQSQKITNTDRMDGL